MNKFTALAFAIFGLALGFFGAFVYYHGDHVALENMRAASKKYEKILDEREEKLRAKNRSDGEKYQAQIYQLDEVNQTLTSKLANFQVSRKTEVKSLETEIERLKSLPKPEDNQEAAAEARRLSNAVTRMQGLVCMDTELPVEALDAVNDVLGWANPKTTHQRDLKKDL